MEKTKNKKKPITMEKTIDLNSSFMSSASAISAIGLESTLTEEFQELKAFQAEVSHQVDRVVDYYERVKDIEKRQRSALTRPRNLRRGKTYGCGATAVLL